MDFLEQDYKTAGLSVARQEGCLAVSGRNPSSALISAHIDRHGLISIGDDEYVYAAQYIKEIKYGENNRLAREELERIARRFEGEAVFAYASGTGEKLGDGIIETCNPCMLNGDALFFVQDMPAMDSGVPIAYAREMRFESGLLKGQIDNAISLGVIHELFRQGFQGTALLTTEEEIGKSWIHMQAFLETRQIETQSLLVLDTSPYTQQDAINKGHIVLRRRDMNEAFNTDLVDTLLERCRALNLPVHIKDEAMLADGKTIDQLGSTELGKLILKTNARWSGATVQIPTLMYHTSSETTTAKAVENYFSLLHNILIDDQIGDLKIQTGDK